MRSYPLMREAGKAIITSFRRVLSQCFYVLEPLRWSLHKEKKVCSYPLIRKAGKAIIMPFRRPAKATIWKNVFVPPCSILLPIAKVEESSDVFSVLFLHSIFNIEKKCVLIIFKAINRETINSECLAPQDMREGRVS